MRSKGKDREPQTTQLCVCTSVNQSVLLAPTPSPAALHEALACSFSHGAASPSDIWALPVLPCAHTTMQGQASSKKAIWFPPAPTPGESPSLVSARMTHLLRVRERKGHLCRTQDYRQVPERLCTLVPGWKKDRCFEQHK